MIVPEHLKDHSIMHRSGPLAFRLFFAALLLFGGEALVWPQTGVRGPLDAVIALTGYGLLATLWLDLTVRYRVRDLFGLMIQAGFYALLAALVIHPQYSYADLPTSLMTRVMGAQALIALEMGGLLLALTGRRGGGAWLIGGAVVVGLAWGSWLSWWPPDQNLPPVELPLLLVVGIGGLAGILALRAVTARLTQNTMVDSLKLGRGGLGGVVLGLLALLVIRLLQGLIDPGALLVSGLLLLLCWTILWFRGREKGATLLDGSLPTAAQMSSSSSEPQSAAPDKDRLVHSGVSPDVQNVWLGSNKPTKGVSIVAAILFIVVSVMAFQSPRITVAEIDQLRFIGLGFTAYGLAWLPTVSLVLGARAFMRQISERLL
jgi:hypothetical protein